MNSKNGFTLIEVLIVLVIISIVAGVAVMSTHGNDRKQSEILADQLRNVIQLAQQEALLRPATLGLAFSYHTYQFFIYSPDEKKQTASWSPITEGPLAKHSYPANLQIRIIVDNQSMQLTGEPVLTFTPSGKMQPFVIFIGKENKDPYYQITGLENGDVKVELFEQT